VKDNLSKMFLSTFRLNSYFVDNNMLLGHYLTVLIEGDGSIIVPKTVRNQKGKLLYPVVKITFVKKDKLLAKKIKNYISVSQKQLYKNTSNISVENNSNLQIMEKIRNFFKVKNVNRIKRVKNNYVELSYEVRTTKKTSCDILINYLSLYPLFSSKYQDFLD
jgi:hypothetical protein